MQCRDDMPHRAAISPASAQRTALNANLLVFNNSCILLLTRTSLSLILDYFLQAQDLAEAPALPGPLLPKEAILASAYQLFPSEEFDLGGKQASFEPSQQHAGFYTITISNSTELVDLQEEWSVISKPVKIDIGEPLCLSLPSSMNKITPNSHD